jgi:hypothetical protein
VLPKGESIDSLADLEGVSVSRKRVPVHRSRCCRCSKNGVSPATTWTKRN